MGFCCPQMTFVVIRESRTHGNHLVCIGFHPSPNDFFFGNLDDFELDNNLCIVLAHAEHIVGALFARMTNRENLFKNVHHHFRWHLSRRAQRAFVWTALPFYPMVSSTRTAGCGGFRKTSVPTSVTNAFMADSMTVLQKQRNRQHFQVTGCQNVGS